MPQPRRLTRSATIAGLAIVAASCSSGTDAAESAGGATNDSTPAATDDGGQGTTGSTTTTTIDIASLPDGPPASIDPATIPRGEPIDFGPAPESPDGPLSAEVQAAVDRLYGSNRALGLLDDDDFAALDTIAASGDPRLTWLIADHLRVVIPLGQITGQGEDSILENLDRLAATASQLTGGQYVSFNAWNSLTNDLIAWDIPAPPNYLEGKRNIFVPVEPAWERLFADNSVLDWRIVSWGGVLIDDRPFDRTDELCNCIPAADNPPVQTAEEATWLTDDAVVFGVVINGEARAYPRQIMEVREMVNDTLGGRDFAMPYCTLCGSAQVWFTDDLPGGIERPVLRTSGLLSRSNKVMYDIVSGSVFDTFLGTADSGPLLDQEIALGGHTVVTSTWGAWVEDNPNTTVLIEDLALGRNFDFRGDDGRDVGGPIFPIGDVDPRLAVQEDVLGVIQADGAPLAIHVDSARAALDRGEVVEIEGIRVLSSGDGVLAIDAEGNQIAGHQSFWFAWSQFYPRTELWPNV